MKESKVHTPFIDKRKIRMPWTIQLQTKTEWYTSDDDQLWMMNSERQEKGDNKVLDYK